MGIGSNGMALALFATEKAAYSQKIPRLDTGTHVATLIV